MPPRRMWLTFLLMLGLNYLLVKTFFVDPGAPITLPYTTFKTGDIVTISTPELGALVNRVVATDTAAPGSFGAADLMRNLAGRGLL